MGPMMVPFIWPGAPARCLGPMPRQERSLRVGPWLLCAEKLLETMPPSAVELRVLRQEVDPYQYIIGR